MSLNSRRGQSLVELIVALGIGTLFIIGAIGALTVTLRLDSQSSHSQPAIELTNALIEELRTISNADWHTLDNLTKDGTTEYQVTTTTTFYAASTGKEPVTLNETTYERYFVLDPVYRDADEQIVDSSGTLDPSTLKVTAITEWSQYGQTLDVRFVTYLGRIRNRLFTQTDWSGGFTNTDGVVSTLPTEFTTSTNIRYSTAGSLTIASTTANLQSTSGNGIDATYRYAWNDVIGWIDFLAYNNVTLSPNTTTTGYGSSSIGYVALDCATSPGGDICPPPGGGSSLFGAYQDGSNNLSGFGWNDSAGWISFDCASANNCSNVGGVDYHVGIDAQGFLTGWAWSDSIGWISFNCDHSQAGDPIGVSMCPNDPGLGSRQGNASSSDYAVKTGASTVSVGELTSLVFDTGMADGVALNTLTWLGNPGDLPVGTRVLFQLATSNCTNGATNAPACNVGGWNFVGPSGTNSDYYAPLDRNIPIKIKRAYHNNVRYIRYKIHLESDSSLSYKPTVRDVIINYSL